jgi:hypothetical protein
LRARLIASFEEEYIMRGYRVLASKFRVACFFTCRSEGVDVRIATHHRVPS